MAIADIFLHVLLVTSIASGSSTPYKLTANKPDGTNDFTLQCQDSNGLSVMGAVFFRDGTPNTTDECLKNAVIMTNETEQDGHVQLTSLKSECDGRYMCGVSAPMGNGYILSGPTEVYASPTVYSPTVKAIQAEEGQDVVFHCPFSRSPLDNYRISLWYNKGGTITTKDTQPAAPDDDCNPNDLVLSNVTIDDAGSYFCQLINIHNHIFTSSNIKLEVYAKFAQPEIIGSGLVYTSSAAGSQFSIGATGTGLNYIWKVNNTRQNTSSIDDDTGSTFIYRDNIPNGRTKVEVLVWNEDQYQDGDSQYSVQQAIFIEKDVQQNVSSSSSSCQLFSASSPSGIANIVFLASLILLIVSTIAAVVGVVVLIVWMYSRKRSQNEKYLQIRVKEKLVRFDENTLKNLMEFLDKIDLIFSLTLDSIPTNKRNPQIDEKLRELKRIVSDWTLEVTSSAGDGRNQSPDPSGDQVPRGDGTSPTTEDTFKVIMPQLNKWIVDENIFE